MNTITYPRTLAPAQVAGRHNPALNPATLAEIRAGLAQLGAHDVQVDCAAADGSGVRVQWVSGNTGTTEIRIYSDRSQWAATRIVHAMAGLRAWWALLEKEASEA